MTILHYKESAGVVFFGFFLVFCQTYLKIFKENKAKNATQADLAFVSSDYDEFIFFSCLL